MRAVFSARRSMQSAGADARMGCSQWIWSVKHTHEPSRDTETKLVVLPEVDDGGRHCRARDGAPEDVRVELSRESGLGTCIAPADVEPRCRPAGREVEVREPGELDRARKVGAVVQRLTRVEKAQVVCRE